MARKILLADDSVTAQNMGRKILADAGYEVITVNNGSAALKKIAELKPDIIILDVYMPGYSGLEVCQRLKEAQETSRIPVLLTVGKLEPFKPEEAKRVRAEGYIVKPFEASELLSALSKLEDKIVPRAESSKPGRFARANAALDEGKQEGKQEGRYDKSMAVEEDSGWKNRIGFPSKKKKGDEPESDDSTIYNAVNKDLRTVVDHTPAAGPQEVKAEEARVDLGALAPEGLPKDVTPEEIAALAAAAARVQGKMSEPEVVENLPDLPPDVLMGAKVAEIPVVEAKAETKVEDKPEVKAEPQAGVEQPKESEAPAATFAAHKPEETVPLSTADVTKESGVSVPSATEMMAAIAGLVSEGAKDFSSGNGSGSHTRRDEQGQSGSLVPARRAEEPVTMAAGAGAGSVGAVSRWKAVAVALAPEESTISLEQEMQKAHAAFAAAEAGRAPIIQASPEISPAVLETAALPQISSPVLSPSENAGVASSAPEPEIARAEATQAEVAKSESTQSESPVSSPAPEVVASAVREFERIAASFTESKAHVEPPAPSDPEPVFTQAAIEPAAQTAPDVPPVVEPAATAAATSQESISTETVPEPANEPAPALEQKIEEAKESKYEQPEAEQPRYEEPKPEELVAVTASPAPVAGEPVQPSVEQSESTASALDGISSSQTSSPVSESVAASEASTRGSKDAAKGESEIAETTAAAWASWRRIRESGDAKGSAQPAKAAPEEKSTLHDSAAMAVAAGAEKSPEDASAPSDESPEIASIVDSVLAGMRPKIVEEISRKLGKKK